MSALDCCYGRFGARGEGLFGYILKTIDANAAVPLAAATCFRL
jgi:hypothetical protein